MFTVEAQDVLFRVTPDAFSISERTVRVFISESAPFPEQVPHTYNKIAAIKKLREDFQGLGLYDAKEIVEYVAKKLGVKSGI